MISVQELADTAVDEDDSTDGEEPEASDSSATVSDADSAAVAPPAAKRWGAMLDTVVVSLEMIHKSATAGAGEAADSSMPDVTAKAKKLRRRIRAAKKVLHEVPMIIQNLNAQLGARPSFSGILCICMHQLTLLSTSFSSCYVKLSQRCPGTSIPWSPCMTARVAAALEKN
jgi:hypothetical protein